MTLVLIFLLGVALGRTSFYFLPSPLVETTEQEPHPDGAGNDCDVETIRLAIQGD